MEILIAEYGGMILLSGIILVCLYVGEGGL